MGVEVRLLSPFFQPQNIAEYRSAAQHPVQPGPGAGRQGLKTHGFGYGQATRVVGAAADEQAFGLQRLKAEAGGGGQCLAGVALALGGGGQVIPDFKGDGGRPVGFEADVAEVLAGLAVPDAQHVQAAGGPVVAELGEQVGRSGGRAWPWLRGPGRRAAVGAGRRQSAEKGGGIRGLVGP